MSLRPIQIAGGGLAGLTLGIGLRRRGIPATIWEAGHYPRHRVCGEFISGTGQDVLTQLDLRNAILDAGASLASAAVFFFGVTPSPPRPVNPTAWCLSRFELDQLLAARFRNLGGDLFEGRRWPAQQCEEGVVCATGRKIQPVEAGWRWFGLKAHARNVHLSADLEMHCQTQAYVGVCRLRDGLANVCGLFRRPAVRAPDASPGELVPTPAASSPSCPAITQQQHPPPAWSEILRGAPGTPLYERLREAVFDPGSFSAVAALPLRPQRAAGRAECCLGDALTMIAPFTGNGMSLAFESAGLALDPLTAYAQGTLTWSQARNSIALACDRAFARRLFWAAFLQRLLFLPSFHSLTRLILCSRHLWRILFSLTR
jgi:menaquinone-9 beta-reductase